MQFKRIIPIFYVINSSLQDSNTSESFNFGSLNGVRGFFTDPSKADDSFVPFKSGINSNIIYDSGSIIVDTTRKYTFIDNYDLILIMFVLPCGEITVNTEAEKLLEYNNVNAQLVSVYLYKNIKANDSISVYRTSVAPAGFAILNIN